MLRIGGTEADRVGYRMGRKKGAKRRDAGEIPGTRLDHELLLKKKLWKRINAFSLAAGFDLLFVVSTGPAQRDASGAWNDSNTRSLIAYTARKGFAVRAWELGNEVNAYPVIARAQESRARIALRGGLCTVLTACPETASAGLCGGPASAVIPAIGEPNPIIPALGRSAAMAPSDVMSWHYYPQQSSRGRFANRRASERTLLEPRRLDSVRKQARRIVKHARGRQVWMTETGHALYGGEPGLSDTYLSSIWWLDQLGLLAREGVSRVFRQSLAGVGLRAAGPGQLRAQARLLRELSLEEVDGGRWCSVRRWSKGRTGGSAHTTIPPRKNRGPSAFLS